ISGGIVGVVLDSDGNHVQGNYIGTNRTGIAAAGNSRQGILISGGANDVIGGKATGAGNVISGNVGNGIQLRGSGTTIKSNLIGIGADKSTAVGNGGAGIALAGDALAANVGGFATNAGNTIAYNGKFGILGNSTSGNRIIANRVFSNGVTNSTSN